MAEATNGTIDARADAGVLRWREAFPALEGSCYLISHSMGCMPQRASADMGEYLDLWQSRSAGAWDEWLPEVSRAAGRIEKLLSAPAGTVMMHANVSLCQAIVASCFEYLPARNKIVYSSLNFPSVSYVWKAEERRGAEVVIVESRDGKTVDTEALIDAIDERTLLVPISHVTYSSSYVQDVKAICAKAKSVGAHVILDCYQSLGVIPVDVVSLGVAFATGGSHKWLCGGPGASYMYVRRDLIDTLEPRITGWMGHARPFSFAMPEQTYASGIFRFMGGTPAIAPLYAARAGAEIVAEIGARRIREHNLALSDKMIAHIDARGFTLHSPREPEHRGGSVIFDFVGAPDIVRELSRHGIFCDHRPGAGVRISAHFYTREDEIDFFFEALDSLRTGT